MVTKTLRARSCPSLSVAASVSHHFQHSDVEEVGTVLRARRFEVSSDPNEFLLAGKPLKSSRLLKVVVHIHSLVQTHVTVHLFQVDIVCSQAGVRHAETVYYLLFVRINFKATLCV